jgi:hypothetical protein
MNSGLIYPERLNFEVPHFLRVAWVNDRAHEVWADRLQSIVRTWNELEWLSVSSRIRDCALVQISRVNYEAFIKRLEHCGLKAEPVDHDGSEIPAGKAKALRVIVGKPQLIPTFQKLLKNENHDEIGRLLGYPDCCRKAFIHRCVTENFLDPTWLMAADQLEDEDSAVQLVKIEKGPVVNMLLRSIGIRPVPHLPCSFVCPASVRFGKQLLECGAVSGYQAEVGLLEQILSWPIEWSALHGIAEIKTPVLKISTKTEATAKKFIVHLKGSGYPEEGAQGLGFPYRMPERMFTTGSPSFQRALNIVQIQPLAK